MSSASPPPYARSDPDPEPFGLPGVSVSSCAVWPIAGPLHLPGSALIASRLSLFRPDSGAGHDALRHMVAILAAHALSLPDPPRYFRARLRPPAPHDTDHCALDVGHPDRVSSKGPVFLTWRDLSGLFAPLTPVGGSLDPLVWPWPAGRYLIGRGLAADLRLHPPKSAHARLDLAAQLIDILAHV